MEQKRRRKNIAREGEWKFERLVFPEVGRVRSEELLENYGWDPESDQTGGRRSWPSLMGHSWPPLDGPLLVPPLMGLSWPSVLP